jgi:hypothetical protein
MNVASIISHVKAAYKVEYSNSGMTKVLHELGFVYKRPDIVPEKVNIGKQLGFLKIFDKLKRKKAAIYSMDGCHPQHNSMPQYG